MTAWSRAPLPLALDYNMKEKYPFTVLNRSHRRVDCYGSEPLLPTLTAQVAQW